MKSLHRIEKHVEVEYNNIMIDVNIDDWVWYDGSIYIVSAWEHIDADETTDAWMKWYQLTYDNPECDGEPIKVEFISDEY